MFEDDVFIENTCLGNGSKRRTKFTRGGSFTQVTWFYRPMDFPRLNMCASAIFVVGTSSIPPKLNYRSVNSYRLTNEAMLGESTMNQCIKVALYETNKSRDAR